MSDDTSQALKPTQHDDASRVLDSIFPELVPDLIENRHAIGENPPYFLVKEHVARELCNLDEWKQRQRDGSSEARRANDALRAQYPNSSCACYLVHKDARGRQFLLSEHVLAVDKQRKILIVGAVPVAGRFKHEEVRAERREMLALTEFVASPLGYDVIVLTTDASKAWGDDRVLLRSQYAEAKGLGLGHCNWLTKVTKGAEVSVHHQKEPTVSAQISVQSGSGVRVTSRGWTLNLPIPRWW